METPGYLRLIRPLVRVALSLPVLLPFAERSLLAQGTCVALSRDGGGTLSIPPGRILTTALTVANLTPGERRFESRLELPPGWRSLTPDVPFAVGGRRSDVRLVSVAVPASAASGVYHLRYQVSDNAVPPCRDALLIDVAVEALRQIEIRTGEAPRFLASGSSCRVTFTLRNRGNARASVRLAARGADHIGALPDSARVSLAPLESRPVSVLVSADPLLMDYVKYVLELRAVLLEDTTVTATASCLLEVIPRNSATAVKFHSIPLDVRVRAAGEPGRSGGQIDVQGGGTITDRGTDRIDLLIRTPDIQSRSVLGLHDEYRLSYTSDRYSVYLGDRAYELTPLTELARYAFGAGGQFTAGDVTAGGFVNQTRFYSPVQNEQGGFVSYGFGPGTSVGVNFLGKEDLHVGNVVTLRGLLRPAEGTDLELEYGMSSLDRSNDDAYAARVRGSARWVSYDVRIVRAGPDFGGYYRNVDFKSASINARPWGNLHFEGFLQDERQNLRDDTLQLVAPRDQFYQIGVGWGELISVYYREVDQRDLLPLPKYNRRESSIQVRSGYSFPVGNLYGSIDLGTSREYLLQYGGPLRRYQLSGNFTPEARLSCGFTAEYLLEQNLFTAGEMETWSGSVNAAISVGSRTRMLASLFGTRAGPPFGQSYSLADLSVEYEFPFGHTLSLRGRQSIFAPAAEGKQSDYLVEYRIPLSIPLTRLSGSGMLGGRVEDALTRTGIQSVVLYAGGATAVTDESGEYVFPSLKPDVYTVMPDIASAGVHRVTTRPAPFLVTVLGGEEARLDIGVIQSASVTGTISVYNFNDAAGADLAEGGLIERGKGSNLLVEMMGRDDTLRQFSDSRGRFQFSDLRPGDWVLRLAEGGLPEYHYIERDSLRLTLFPREARDTAFRVLPKRRNIQILQEGNLQGEPRPPAVGPPPKEKERNLAPVPGKPPRPDARKDGIRKRKPAPKPGA